MRSIWKGHIRFSLVNIPIQIFKAVETKNNISFNQLHKEDMGRIAYKKQCRVCKETVTNKEIVKGYEYDDDKYVVISSKEMEAIKLKSNKAIDLEAFVGLDEVPATRFEDVYYVGPSTEVAKPTYSLFVQALKKSKKSGIGRIILRDREDVVLLTPIDDALIMYKLRYPYEIRDIDDVPNIEKVKVDKKQLDLAQHLIDSLTTSFEEVDFEDRYQDALMELVEQKIDGKEIVVSKEGESEAPVVDIMDALKASIEEAKKLKKGA